MDDKKKYDQLEMELSKGTLDAISSKNDEDEKIEEIKTEAPATKKEKFVMPETLSIEEALEEEDDEKVSPKAEIFKKYAGKDEGRGYAATFHGADKDEEVKLDDTYESSSQADHQFMATFGLSSGSQPVINISDRTGQSSTEIDTLQGDIHSDYYEYTDRLQRKEISGMYKFARRSIKNRLIFASIFALFLFLIENIKIFVKNPTGIFANPYVLVISNMLFFTCCRFFHYRG